MALAESRYEYYSDSKAQRTNVWDIAFAAGEQRVEVRLAVSKVAKLRPSLILLSRA